MRVLSVWWLRAKLTRHVCGCVARAVARWPCRDPLSKVTRCPPAVQPPQEPGPGVFTAKPSTVCLMKQKVICMHTKQVSDSDPLEPKRVKGATPTLLTSAVLSRCVMRSHGVVLTRSFSSRCCADASFSERVDVQVNSIADLFGPIDQQSHRYYPASNVVEQV